MLFFRSWFEPVMLMLFESQMMIGGRRIYPHNGNECEEPGQADGGVIGRAGCVMPTLNGATLVRDLDGEGLEQLRVQAEIVAEREVSRAIWRQSPDGVLPYGYDAPSIAAEAVEELALGDGKSSKVFCSGEELYFELQRVIRRTVRRLNRLTENKLLVSEWDVLPLDEEGEPRSVFDVMEGKIPSPDEEAMRKEGAAAVEKFRREFRAFLGKDEELQGVYACLCGEIVSREEVAKRLGVGVEAVKNARGRLERRLVEFGEARPDYKRMVVEALAEVSGSSWPKS
jgi:hypothetical protein